MHSAIINKVAGIWLGNPNIAIIPKVHKTYFIRQLENKVKAKAPIGIIPKIPKSYNNSK
jgi:hypothetical protein